VEGTSMIDHIVDLVERKVDAIKGEAKQAA
jgi:hypothetical protein